MFQTFFNRPDTFALGVCNGCQILAQLSDLIPGSNYFPKFTKNISEQYEARLVMVEIAKSPSVLFQNMTGSQLPIIVSHGEGFTHFNNEESHSKVHTLLNYIDYHGKITETYPYNPNGSPDGIAGVCNKDGRFNLLMPHPERVVRTLQMSWHDKTWGPMSPWFQIFLNAWKFVQ